jgi:hypothetical protein
MKMTRDQCSSCGDHSTASFSDGSFECLRCRLVTYDPYLTAADGFEANIPVEHVRPQRRIAQPAIDRRKSLSTGPSAPKAVTRQAPRPARRKILPLPPTLLTQTFSNP